MAKKKQYNNLRDEPTEHLRNIPFSTMLGGPVEACIQAQVDAANSTRRYIESVCFETDYYGRKKSVMLSFDYVFEGKYMRLTMPLIAIVPVPFFCVDSLDIEFNANVTGYENNSIQCKFARINRGNSEKNDGTSTFHYSNENVLNVRLHASQDNMPGGLGRVLNILEQYMHIEEPVTPSTPIKIELTPEKVNLKVGKRVTLKASTDTDVSLKWTTDKPDLIRVSKKGRVTALKEGIANVIVSHGSDYAAVKIIITSNDDLPTTSFTSGSGQSTSHYGIEIIPDYSSTTTTSSTTASTTISSSSSSSSSSQSHYGLDLLADYSTETSANSYTAHSSSPAHYGIRLIQDSNTPRKNVSKLKKQAEAKKNNQKKKISIEENIRTTRPRRKK